MSLASGSRLGHYIIGPLLGAGGMGEVYRASDTKLERDVALKVLPAAMASNPDMVERFRREARAVAALSHVHIVTIHSVEEASGLHFLTMELVEGRSMDRLIAQGPMAIPRILAVATALADALAAAHERGIIHRDLKPANVMASTSGGIKVLDFGLARFSTEHAPAESAADQATVMRTNAGVVMGTGPYMSPEQVQGREVDHRTDLFSLGVVLHEMTTGRRPFNGGSTAGVFAAILRDPAPPVSAVRPDAPPALVAVITRCLEKDPDLRFQTARDAASALRGVRMAPVDSGGTPLTGAVSSPSAAATDEGFWVAVLPFRYTGTSADMAGLAEGLAEEIVTGLSRFSYLRVIARGSTSQYGNMAVDVRAVGKDLGARYVIDGSLRQAGAALRVSVQLVDTATGAHLWADTYNRPFVPEEIFALQDELVPRIVSTVADVHGVLPRSMTEAARTRPPDQLSPYEAVLRSFGYFERVTAEDLAASRSGLELAVRQAPSYADAWAMLAVLCVQDHAQGFGLDVDALANGLTAARRAVEVAPSSHLAHFSLAQALFFQKDLPSFRNAAERAATLNPMDGNSIAFLGELLTYAGDPERGLALAERAKQLNPHHPGWYWYANFYDAYRRGDDRGALGFALKVNMPGHWSMQYMKAAAFGQLGERDAARQALQDLITLRPEFAATLRSDLEKWWDRDYRERLIDGLRKAGLDVPSEARASGRQPAVEAAPARSIAVLPFANLSADPENQYFSDGLSDEIINALTRLPGLRVIARTSAFRFRGEHDVRKVGEALGVRTVLEGSVRKAGERLRITAQLIDAVDQSHIWSERFDRDLVDVFAIQDEIATAIVEKLHLSLGVAAGPAPRSTRDVAAYEALLEGRHYFSQFTPEGAERALACARRALDLDPRYPDALVLQAFYHVMSAYMFVDPREALPQAKALADRALAVDPHHGEAHAVVALVTGWMDLDWPGCERMFQRALAAAPASARVHELRGLISLLGTGRFDEALLELDTAVELDPLSALYAGNRGRVLTCMRRFAEAEVSCRRGLALDPGQLLVQVELIYALTFQGKFAEAHAIGRKAVDAGGGANATVHALAVSLACAGKRDDVMRLLSHEGGADGGPYQSPLTRGLVHAAFSEMDAAFEHVHRAFDERDPLLMYLAVHPIFDALRPDRRYSKLLGQMHL